MRLGVLAAAVLGAGVTLALIFYFGFAGIAAALLLWQAAEGGRWLGRARLVTSRD